MAGKDLVSTDRIEVSPSTDNLKGTICWDASKSLFYCVMATIGVAAIPFTDTSDWLVFIGLTGITILAGHSVGMHRLLIHRSFSTPLWVEYVLVYLGVLVGMAGPKGMIHLHDMRDWHQRQSQCPAFPSHATGFWQDAFWQLHCKFTLDHSPRVVLEPKIANSIFYHWLENTWMFQQIPLAIILFLIGGPPLVGIGIGLRVFVSLTGHWVVGHFAHKRGDQKWVIEGLPVQGYNLPYLSWITFGENWHGNHHAFPESALLGVEAHQSDPGFMFVKTLEKFGLAWDLMLPENCQRRAGLKLVASLSPAAS